MGGVYVTNIADVDKDSDCRNNGMVIKTSTVVKYNGNIYPKTSDIIKHRQGTFFCTIKTLTL